MPTLHSSVNTSAEQEVMTTFFQQAALNVSIPELSPLLLKMKVCPCAVMTAPYTEEPYLVFHEFAGELGLAVRIDPVPTWVPTWIQPVFGMKLVNHPSDANCLHHAGGVASLCLSQAAGELTVAALAEHPEWSNYLAGAVDMLPTGVTLRLFQDDPHGVNFFLGSDGQIYVFSAEHNRFVPYASLKDFVRYQLASLLQGELWSQNVSTGQERAGVRLGEYGE